MATAKPYERRIEVNGKPIHRSMGVEISLTAIKQEAWLTYRTLRSAGEGSTNRRIRKLTPGESITSDGHLIYFEAEELTKYDGFRGIRLPPSSTPSCEHGFNVYCVQCGFVSPCLGRG